MTIAPPSLRRRGKKSSTPPSGRNPRSTRARGELRAALLFVGPATLGFAVFYVWPAIRGFYYSFTDFSVLSPETWVGTENYSRLISDRLVWNAFGVTLEYVVLNIAAQTVLALLIAVLMHRFTKSMFVRGTLLLPYLVANVVVALTWFWMLDYQIGIVNQMMEWVGLDRIAFFGDSAWAIPTIAFVNVWRHVGYTALLIFAGLQTIPDSIYEAAALDGSSETRTFFKITVPLLRPVLAMVLVITVTGSFQIFDTVAVTTAGGPINATRVIYYYIYDLAFTRFEFGYASAISVVLFLVLASVAYFQIKLLRAGESDLS
ncbi:carbohydrate ABC transporter permease [Pengzhenrongella sicca]|uniref:Sugar ABC transporter permease n=1 Tax=Pengzhenrongella sicca TaxID=2819238 RepID=A0A8A4ZBP7_9MICO|nr:sugar ABC transporter permease [Pengzhenrongella sicca]QTE28429.1 sugar ABC transporter permease [Pengzhenrongella sicca]